jgi:hypothetical protein
VCAILRGEVNSLPDGEERDRLLAAARANRVDRLVAARTGAIDADYRAAAMLDEIAVRELNRVLAALEASGISPLVFKGAAIAHTHYDESWHRQRVDADLLIAPGDRQRAIDALHRAGYLCPTFISGELVMGQMPFARVGSFGGEHHLDLHWRLANPQVFASLPDYVELLRRARAILVRGQQMRTLCPVDSLLLACVHRAAHHNRSDDLVWLLDIHLLAQRFTPAEWIEFVALACQCEVRALCADALLTAHKCFDTSIPPDAISRLNDAGVTEPASVFLRKDLTRFDRFRIDCASLAPRARWRLAREHAIPPAAYIREKYGVRRRVLLPIFYLRRVIDGLTRFMSRPA